MRVTAIVLSVALAVLALVGGCGRKAAPKTSKPEIALVMKSLANEFFKTMEDGAKTHQKARASEYTLLANGTKDELDVARQVDLVEQMIARDVDAIVIAPADSKALVPVCRKAIRAGIRVVNIDNKFDADALEENKVSIPFVGPDNRKGAKMSAMQLAIRLKPGDKVAIVEGAPNAYNATQRKLGFEDAIRETKLKLVSSQSGNWEMDKGNQVVAGMITEHPDLKGVFCANDNMALGAVSALKAAGKLDKVLVAGFDNISAVRQLVNESKIVATVDQHADRMAVYGIEYALRMLKSDAKPTDQETPVDLITGTQ